MKTLKKLSITNTLFAKIEELDKVGKIAWIVYNENGATDVCESRSVARTQAAWTQTDRVGKAAEFDFQIEAPALPVALPVHAQLAAFIAEPVENKANLAAAPLAPVVVSPTKTKTPKIPLIRESTIERPCKQVWHIASNMLGEILNKLTDQHKEGDNKPMPTEKDALALLRRKDVLAACVASGIAYYTARTQYQMWLTIQNGGTL